MTEALVQHWPDSPDDPAGDSVWAAALAQIESGLDTLASLNPAFLDTEEKKHLKPWSQGGLTNLDDLVLLCDHHHHVIHNPAYDYERLADGAIKFHRRT